MAKYHQIKSTSVTTANSKCLKLIWNTNKDVGMGKKYSSWEDTSLTYYATTNCSKIRRTIDASCVMPSPTATTDAIINNVIFTLVINPSWGISYIRELHLSFLLSYL